MSLRVAVFGVACLLGFPAGAMAAQAQDRVQPTGTPTWVPRKVVATPTPLTPLEAEAKELGKKLSKIDEVVWMTVREHWSDSKDCLEAVDAHLKASKATVQELIRESNVINCTIEEETNRRKVRLVPEARKTFKQAYRPSIESLKALKQDFDDKPEAQSVLHEVRNRQRQWQSDICEALASVKPPIVVPRPKPQPQPNQPVQAGS